MRNILAGQQRVTATFRRADGRTLHVRTATAAEPAQKAIHDALGIDPHPGDAEDRRLKRPTHLPTGTL